MNATIKEANAKTKIRRQGNSQILTVPADFQLPDGISVLPTLMNDGVYYQFVKEDDSFFNFDVDILNDILADESIPRRKVAEVFIERKAKMPQAIEEFTKEALATSKVMSEEEMRKEVGL